MIVKVDILQEDIDKSIQACTKEIAVIAFNCLLSTAFKRIFDVQDVSTGINLSLFDKIPVALPPQATKLIMEFDEYLNHHSGFRPNLPAPTSFEIDVPVQFIKMKVPEECPILV
jgi:hypothetical protein